MEKTHRILLAFSAVMVLGACGPKDEKVADTTAAMAEPAPAPAPAAPAVTDPQIAAIVVAANDADIQGGRQAASKSKNAGVKAFAQRMITDHGGVNKAAKALVTKLGVTPEETDASRQQKTAGDESRESLKGKTGVEFDRAYIAHEVTYHEGLLDAIDKLLLPSVQNAELKALLDQTRPAVVSHLKAAQDLKVSLGS